MNRKDEILVIQEFVDNDRHKVCPPAFAAPCIQGAFEIPILDVRFRDEPKKKFHFSFGKRSRNK